MAAGHTGVSGLPAVRRVDRVLSQGLVPARVPLLSMGAWIALAMRMRSESALSATALSTASGCLSLIGQTVARAAMRALAGGLETSMQRNMEGMTVPEMLLKLRSATHRPVQVR